MLIMAPTRELCQ